MWIILCVLMMRGAGEKKVWLKKTRRRKHIHRTGLMESSCVSGLARFPVSWSRVAVRASVPTVTDVVFHPHGIGTQGRTSHIAGVEDTCRGNCRKMKQIAPSEECRLGPVTSLPGDSSAGAFAA